MLWRRDRKIQDSSWQSFKIKLYDDAAICQHYQRPCEIMKLPIKDKEDYKNEIYIMETQWNCCSVQRFSMNSCWLSVFKKPRYLGKVKLTSTQRGYYEYYSYAEKKGTQELRFCKEGTTKCRVRNRWSMSEGSFNHAWGMILYMQYSPNAQNELKRDYRMEYELTCIT